MTAPEASLGPILVGDAAEVLGTLPDNVAQCAVTSPPYWGMRDYGVAGQIGLEPSLPEYVAHLAAVFRQVRRVLRDDGLLWLNVGDGYTSGNRGWRAPDKKNPARGMSTRPQTPEGLKPKDLLCIPWRLAMALQDDGWYLRADVVWSKGNAMPETVRDRPSRSHEYLFLLSKRERYYYDREGTRDPADPRRRSVWSINTRAFAGAHFATFPPQLAAACVRSASRPGDLVLDPFFGSGTVGIVAQELGRRYLGIELNPEYAALAETRLKNPK